MNIENSQRYYGEVLGGSNDLRTDACCTTAAPSPDVSAALANLHDEVKARHYGCVLVMPQAIEGLHILDLGSGSGQDAYLLAQMVGESGSVTGVDATPEQLAVAEPGVLPHEPPFPAPMLRMVDRIDGYLPDGGAKGLGLVQGRIKVDPEFWFFKAHFFQDPVWPGSLGVESFLQLLKYAAWKRWGEPAADGWQTVAPHRKHAWTYRGQVLPTDGEVVVVLEITVADDAERRLTADGFLTVDGRVIYQMTGFTLE